MYAFFEKGYVTNALFALIMAEFRKVIAGRHPHLAHLLYMDRLGALLQPGSRRTPPNSSSPLTQRSSPPSDGPAGL